MTPALTLISSMATRPLLAALLPQLQAETGEQVHAEAVGGVDAARRVRAGEAFDAVMLSAQAIDELVAAGRVRAGSRVDIVRSAVAVAVREGAPVPALQTAGQVREAVLAARSIGYSTGPSGVHLQQLFERWGIAGPMRERTVQARPGEPVASLVADGRVELGFQQLSELLGVPGVTVAGLLPDEIQVVTTFSAGVCTTAADPQRVQRVLQWLASPATTPLKQRLGMDAAG